MCTHRAFALVAVLAAISACAVRDVPASAESCAYRCGSVCPPGFECREGYCVAPGFSASCTPDAAAPEPALCLPGDGLLAISPASFVQACTGQELAIGFEVAGGSGPFQWFSPSQAPDLVLEESGPRAAQLRGTLRDAGSFELSVGVRDARNCVQLSLPFDVAETPAITTALPAACAGEPVALELAAQGGDPGTYSWTSEGTAPVELQGSRLYGRAPAAAGEYPVRLTLRDARCPMASAAPVTLDTVWTVRSASECPRIETSALPAPCEGLAYSQALVASGGSGTGYVWEALSSQLPSGLVLDAGRGVVQGTPSGLTRSGALEVQLTDSRGQRAAASIDLSLRSDCRMAWIADEPARLHVGDVFLSDGGLVLPQDLPPTGRVLDMKFSPDRAWLAFRAGVPGDERLHLHSMAAPRSVDARRVDFVCPDAAVCAVLDYAWSRDSAHLAVVLSDGSDRDFVSGLSITDQTSLATWPVLGTALSNATVVPLQYVRDLSWATGDSFGFVGASGPDEPPQTIFLARAGVEAPPQSAPYYDRDLRLRQTPTGWVVFDGFAYTATALVPPNSVALHAVAWASPSGEYAASINVGALSIYAINDAGVALATTEPRSCAVVAGWAPQANGFERIFCSGGSLDAPDGNQLRVFDFDLERRVFDPPAGRGVPLNGLYVPAPLANTRRFFSSSADWLVLGAPEQGVALLPIPWGAPTLPRATAQLSVSARAELRFTPDGRLLLIYDENGLRSWTLPGPEQSTLSLDDAGGLLAPPNLAACTEAVWASPDNWCGAPTTLSHFAISRDSKSVLFEGDQGLWVADLGLTHDRAARRVALRAASCGSSCVGVTYDFAP
jgi:hypothetical protein